MPIGLSEELAHLAKIQIDHRSRKPLEDADLFVFYNGCGLDSARWFRRNGGIAIVEAVNSHVQVQEQLLEEEHRRLGLAWRPFHAREVRRRVAEVEEAEYVLLPSAFVAKSFLAKGIPAERLLQVPYRMAPIPGTSDLAPRKQADDGIFRVLYVGSVSVRKGLRYLIEAFRQFKHPKKELWIVGPIGSPSGLEGTLPPAETKILGPLKGNALQKAYSDATVFCLPSIEDGFGLVLIEAIYYGLPVIATENTGIHDLLEEGKGGMVVPIRDAGAICDCLTRLADDPQFLGQKRKEATDAKTRLKNQTQTTSVLATTLTETFGMRH